jgi:hypothetical protein
VALVFSVFALGGSYFVSHQMNKAADTHASSAGRSGDPEPNARQTQPQPSTTGANPDSAVPPARQQET